MSPMVARATRPADASCGSIGDNRKAVPDDFTHERECMRRGHLGKTFAPRQERKTLMVQFQAQNEAEKLLETKIVDTEYRPDPNASWPENGSTKAARRWAFPLGNRSRFADLFADLYPTCPHCQDRIMKADMLLHEFSCFVAHSRRN